MEIREWRQLAVRSAVLLGVVLLFSILCFIQRYGNIEHTVHAQNQLEDVLTTLPKQTLERQEATASKKKKIKSLSDTYIRISKSDKKISKAYIDEDYMNVSICLTLEGVGRGDYHSSDILRYCYGERYSGNAQGGQDVVKKISMTYHESGVSESVRIRIQLKDLYDAALYETAEGYYISLEAPEKMYDKIVVIDAGHGGMDEGATSLDGKYLEKDYTLILTKYLKELLDSSNIKAYYTRLNDEEISKAARTRLANAVSADAFISIHCNASEPGETTANGMEALYSGKKETDNGILTSKKLSLSVLNQVCAVTGRKSRGVIQRNKLYLMNHAKVPVTIIEIGYMSNQSDLRYMLKEKNQKEVAEGIYKGIEDVLK